MSLTLVLKFRASRLPRGGLGAQPRRRRNVLLLDRLRGRTGPVLPTPFIGSPTARALPPSPHSRRPPILPRLPARRGRIAAQSPLSCRCSPRHPGEDVLTASARRQ